MSNTAGRKRPQLFLVFEVEWGVFVWLQFKLRGIPLLGRGLEFFCQTGISESDPNQLRTFWIPQKWTLLLPALPVFFCENNSFIYFFFKQVSLRGQKDLWSTAFKSRTKGRDTYLRTEKEEQGRWLSSKMFAMQAGRLEFPAPISRTQKSSQARQPGFVSPDLGGQRQANPAGGLASSFAKSPGAAKDLVQQDIVEKRPDVSLQVHMQVSTLLYRNIHFPRKNKVSGAEQIPPTHTDFVNSSFCCVFCSGLLSKSFSLLCFNEGTLSLGG